jgi:hypothetical protein
MSKIPCKISIAHMKRSLTHSFQCPDWGIAMFGGVAFLSSIYYIVHGRKVYTGPVAHVKKDF